MTCELFIPMFFVVLSPLSQPSFNFQRKWLMTILMNGQIKEKEKCRSSWNCLEIDVSYLTKWGTLLCKKIVVLWRNKQSLSVLFITNTQWNCWLRGLLHKWTCFPFECKQSKTGPKKLYIGRIFLLKNGIFVHFWPGLNDFTTTCRIK